MNYSFIITVDTEGDNLWGWEQGQPIETRNAEFVDRFQALCDQFDYKPVYLTNYEMAMNERFMHKLSVWQREGRCEIGIHPHAWNNPPIVDLQGPYNGRSYLIEYSTDIMRQKFQMLYDLIASATGHPPVSHRAGRWAMNEQYFNLLYEFNIKVDCSHTPFISWKKSKGVTIGGCDYRRINPLPSMIDGILEVPLTVRINKRFFTGSWKHRLKTFIIGTPVWLRPATETKESMIWLENKISRESTTNYLEFMIHSSELMPGGSPYNLTEYDVELFFNKIEVVFAYAKKLGFEGKTLCEYYESFTIQG